MTEPPSRPARHTLLAAAARELAELTHSAAGAPPRLESLRQLARCLREATARATTPGPSSGLDARQALALAASRSPESVEDPVLVDLRLFGRLTLNECADLLHVPYEILKRRWQRIQPTLFATARELLLQNGAVRTPNRPRPKPPTLDSEGSEL